MLGVGGFRDLTMELLAEMLQGGGVVHLGIGGCPQLDEQTPSVFCRLVELTPSLTALNAHSNDRGTFTIDIHEDLEPMLRGLPELRSLDISGCSCEEGFAAAQAGARDMWADDRAIAAGVGPGWTLARWRDLGCCAPAEGFPGGHALAVVDEATRRSAIVL